MRRATIILLCTLLLTMGCAAPPPISPETLAKERARQSVDRLNARVVHAYQERQEALARVQRLQERLHHPGLSSKDSANVLIDIEDATRGVMDTTEHVAALEEELRREWTAYRAHYGDAPPPAGPSRR
jgi:hypothetical protein